MVARCRIVAALAALVVALAPTAAPGRPAWQRYVHRQLDRVVDEGVPGALSLVRGSQRTRRITSGVANRKTHAPMRAVLRYRIASETKTFVAALTLKLAEEGLLTLNDTVEKWLPGVVPSGSEITIRQLLNHTSGIYNYTNDERVFEPYATDPGYYWGPEQLVDIAVSHEPLFAPGTDWDYSNTGYILVGMIAEKAAGAPLPELLQSRIFDPLELDDTYLPITEATLAGPHSHGYLLPGKKLPLPNDKPLDVTRLSPSWAWAAGGMVSDADDVAEFYAALLGGRLLSPESLAEMKEVVPADYGGEYGLGLVRAPTPCGDAWGHDGLFPGFSSLALSSEDGRRQAVLMQNASDIVPKAARRAFARAVLASFCRTVPKQTDVARLARVLQTTR